MIFSKKSRKPNPNIYDKMTRPQGWVLIGAYTAVIYADRKGSEQDILHFESRKEAENYRKNGEQSEDYIQQTLF